MTFLQKATPSSGFKASDKGPNDAGSSLVTRSSLCTFA
jgi:hypothetical protein